MMTISEATNAEMAADIAIRKEVEQAEGDRIVEQEKAVLAGGAEAAKAKKWHGIALSGGGIRSSTFCTGILQALANDDRLKDFDYMSSVSGGGFIGCSLRWWWHGKHGVKDDDKDVEFGTGPDDFPYGTSDPRDPNARDKKEQEANLSFLRNHGYYLTPGSGITLWSGLAVVVRTILLNILVWIPIAVGIFYLFWWAKADWPIISTILGGLPNGGSPLPEAVICPRWVTEAGQIIDQIRVLEAPESCVDEKPVGLFNVLTLPPIFAILIWLSYGLLGLFLVGSLFYSIQTSQTHGAGKPEFTKSHVQWMLFALGIIALGIALSFYDTKSFWVQGFICGLYFFAAAILFRMLIVLVRNLFGDRDAKDKKPNILLNMSQVYYLRRFFEIQVSKWFKYLIAFLIFGFVPVIFHLAFTLSGSPGFTGLFSLAAGVAAALMAHSKAFRAIGPGFVEKAFIPIGAGLFLFGVIVLSYQIAMILIEVGLLGIGADSGTSAKGLITSETAFEIVTTSFAKLGFTEISGPARYTVSVIIAFLVLIAFFMARFVNTNQISLNRFYRDRLMEAYMPHAEAVKSGESGPTPADGLELRELWKRGASGGRAKGAVGPYPLVNTNCVLVNDDEQKVHLRGGDNYVLSPLFCGSTATGWFDTESKACRMLTLPTAMATSGAAANPNSGFIGTGPTRERLLSIVMMLLNVRLGLWVVNPNLSWMGSRLRSQLRRLLPSWLGSLLAPWLDDKPPRPNHIRPGGQYAITNKGFRRDSPFLELTDGGHFDNSGLYELIRRKCAVIVACDGEADKEFGFASFVSLQRRIAEDFGAKLAFPDPATGDPDFLPKNTIPSKELSYPKGALCAELPFFYADIIYVDGSKGRLIYIKSTMIEDLSFTTRGYKAENPDFPHETTADQFFDPQQFEVYRELGYYAAKTTMRHFNEDWTPKKEPEPEQMDRKAIADTPAKAMDDNTAIQQRGD